MVACSVFFLAIYLIFVGPCRFGWIARICTSSRSHNALLIKLLFTSVSYQTLVLVLSTISLEIPPNQLHTFASQRLTSTNN